MWPDTGDRHETLHMLVPQRFLGDPRVRNGNLGLERVQQPERTLHLATLPRRQCRLGQPSPTPLAAVRTFFDTFRRTGSATATVRSFREQGLLFPRRLSTGPHKGEVAWTPLLHSRARRVLWNPRYTGAFVYGRPETHHAAGGKEFRRLLPRDKWHTVILNAHPGYITWEEYEDNLRRLHENAQACGADRRKSPPREGPALLQGLVVCGRCGRRMSVGYYVNGRGKLVPEYHCEKQLVEAAEPLCQRLVRASLDRAPGDLLVETVTPLALEVALAVRDELQARADEADRLRRQQVERARYEAELAQRRYLRVDPDNRLVAESLEADWNRKLRALADAQDDYERRRQTDGASLTDDQRQEVLALAASFPKLWHDPAIPQRERKPMVRLFIEDVTLIRTDEIIAHVRFRGGATQTLHIPLPLPAPLLRKPPPAIVAEVDRLMGEHTDAEISAILRQRGIRLALGEQFTPVNVRHLRATYGLYSRFERLRAEGMLTLPEMAARLGIHPQTVKRREREGFVIGHVYDDKWQRLYEPSPQLPQAACQWCGSALPTAWTMPGQHRKWCSSRCLYAAHRAKARLASRAVHSRQDKVPVAHPTHEVQSVA